MTDDFCSPWWAERIAEIEAARPWPEHVAHIPAMSDAGVCCHDWSVAARCVKPPREFIPLLGDCRPTKALSYHHLAFALGDRTEGTLMEWGAGYGMSVALSRQFWPDVAHVVIDLPTMADVQRHWLEQNRVGFFDRVGWVTAHQAQEMTCDVFMGMFSLSESTAGAHDLCFDADWFGASRVALAMEPDKDDLFADGSSLYRRCLDAGFVERDAPVWSGVYLELDR